MAFTEPTDAEVDEAYAPSFNLFDAMMEFEQGDPTEEQVVELFQALIDNGWAWQLQGFYGRTAAQLIAAGLCHAAGE